jgi:hypothetical protein
MVFTFFFLNSYFIQFFIFIFPRAQLVLSQLVLNSFRLVNYIKPILQLHFKILGLRSFIFFKFLYAKNKIARFITKF